MNFEQKRKKDKLASCSIQVQVFSKSKTLRFLSASSFLLYLTCRQLLPKVSQGLHQLKADWSRKYFQKCGLSWRCAPHDWWQPLRGFLNSRLGIFKSQELFCLGVFVLLTCKQPLLNFCRGFYKCLIRNNVANIFKTTHQVGQNIEKILPRRHLCVSDVLNWKWTFCTHLSCDFEQTFGQIVSVRVRTFSHTNLVASRN